MSHGAEAALEESPAVQAFGEAEQSHLSPPGGHREGGAAQPGRDPAAPACEMPRPAAAGGGAPWALLRGRPACLSAARPLTAGAPRSRRRTGGPPSAPRPVPAVRPSSTGQGDPAWPQTHRTRTCQRTLVLCQVKDFVEIALLGAVDAAGVLVLAQAGRRAGHVAPRGRRLQLPRAHSVPVSRDVQGRRRGPARTRPPRAQPRTRPRQEAATPRRGTRPTALSGPGPPSREPLFWAEKPAAGADLLRTPPPPQDSSHGGAWHRAAPPRPQKPASRRAATKGNVSQTTATHSIRHGRRGSTRTAYLVVSRQLAAKDNRHGRPRQKRRRGPRDTRP